MHEPAARKRGAAEEGSPGDVVRIRTLREADLEAVMEIEEASFATPWTRETFVNLLKRPNARLFAAVGSDARLLGYAAVWFAGGSSELGDLAVHPSARRAGVGARLVGAVLEEGRSAGAREMFLEVRAGNVAAQALYRRHGFEVVGRRPDYYADPTEDALVMRHTLDRPPGAAG